MQLNLNSFPHTSGFSIKGLSCPKSIIPQVSAQLLYMFRTAMLLSDLNLFGKSQTSFLCSQCFPKGRNPHQTNLESHKPPLSLQIPLSFWLMVTVRWGALDASFPSVFTSLRWLWTILTSQRTLYGEVSAWDHQENPEVSSHCQASLVNRRADTGLCPGICCSSGLEGGAGKQCCPVLHQLLLGTTAWATKSHHPPAVQSDSKWAVFRVQVVTGYQGWATRDVTAWLDIGKLVCLWGCPQVLWVPGKQGPLTGRAVQWTVQKGSWLWGHSLSLTLHCQSVKRNTHHWDKQRALLS